MATPGNVAAIASGTNVTGAPAAIVEAKNSAAGLGRQGGAAVVQDQLGHSTIVLTADTHTSVLPETARTAAERTAALVFPARCVWAGRGKPAARLARKPPLPAWARRRRRGHRLVA